MKPQKVTLTISDDPLKRNGIQIVVSGEPDLNIEELPLDDKGRPDADRIPLPVLAAVEKCCNTWPGRRTRSRFTRSTAEARTDGRA